MARSQPDIFINGSVPQARPVTTGTGIHSVRFIGSKVGVY
jgi:hypothetical protein